MKRGCSPGLLKEGFLGCDGDDVDGTRIQAEESKLGAKGCPHRDLRHFGGSP